VTLADHTDDRRPCVIKAFEQSRAKGTDLLVLLAIASFAYPDGTGAFPGEGRIARLVKKSDRTVRRSIESLVELGELIVHYKGGPRGRTNAYTVTLPDLDTATSTSDADTAMSRSDHPDPDIAVSGSDFPDLDTAMSAPTRTSSAPTWTSGVADPDTAMSTEPLEPSVRASSGANRVPTRSGSGREQPPADYWQCPNDGCQGAWPQDQAGCVLCGTERP